MTINYSNNKEVRVDFVPKDDYLSRDFLKEEEKFLWSRVWQVACREEELKNIGDYVTYDILNESIIVTMVGEQTYKAFFNVCQHRGRRLVDGCGRTGAFRCKFHGWQWDLDGRLAKVHDRHDWEGCSEMEDEDLRLKEVKVASWGGFIFINMDPDAESLESFLDPMPKYLDCYQFEKMRYRWYKSVKLPCNWKVATEAFTEGYHVWASHPQLLENGGDDHTLSYAMGKHGRFGYPPIRRPAGAPSSRTGKPMPEDLRPGTVALFQEFEDTVKAIFTSRDNEAVRRLMTEVPPTASPMEVIEKSLQFQKEAAIASGAGWADVSFEQMFNAGTDWHVFPNLVLLMWPDGGLSYRARPDGDNPNSCIFDMWSLARYAPGAEPALKREYFYGADDWTKNAVENFGLVIAQDLANVREVQRGMSSKGFVGARTNPVQEKSISNFHAVLHEFMRDGRN